MQHCNICATLQSVQHLCNIATKMQHCKVCNICATLQQKCNIATKMQHPPFPPHLRIKDHMHPPVHNIQGGGGGENDEEK